MPLMSKSLALSLGTTSVISVLLFIYFRNKISAVEHKVSMLFKLIEDHHQQQQVQFRQTPTVPTRMISVSDDEDDDDASDDDDDDSTDDGESVDERLSFRAGNVAEIKTIEIEELATAEREPDNLDDIPSLGDDDDDEMTKPQNPFKETNNDVVYNNLMQGISKKAEIENFSIMRIKDLKKICATRGINKYSHLNKAGLVKLLESSE